ncbi:MAG: hypothetical protein IKR69_06040 [Bacteroidales bacterium]|nr:hypothetical protein [Bacteroidales bacterium]
MSIFRRICAITVGLVFLTSGLLKVMDPVGTGLIVTEYFRLVGLGISLGLAKAFGAVLSMTELSLAAMLITGTFRRIAAFGSLILTGCFTIVTALMLIFNPSMDCGCFGEAIHLSHAESFFKNIVLLLMLTAAFSGKAPEKPGARKYVSFALAEAGFIFALASCLASLPPIDFTDFAPGNELMASANDQYELEDGTFVGYVYEKNGQRGTFPEDHLPDDSWTFIRRDTVARSSMDTHADTPVLSFSNAEGEYLDDLAVYGRVLVISVYDSAKADAAAIADLAKRAAAIGFTPLVLSSGGCETLRESIDSPLVSEVYFSDYKTLITLNRKNGGATVIIDGEIIQKFPSAAKAKDKYLKRAFNRDPMDTTIRAVTRPRIRAQAFLLYTLAILFFV